MRHPLSSRGPTPTTCHACRASHPNLGWCDYHKEPHARERFSEIDRPIGILNICKDAVAYQVAAKRGKSGRECPSCLRYRESWDFRGGRMKMAACRECIDAHPSEGWCVDCEEWLQGDSFYSTGKNGSWKTTRCKRCLVAARHGVTMKYMHSLTGGPPQCAACGSLEALKIDHDHGHCRAKNGCRECVRGWLCHACNTAEGLLQTPERAQALATYMLSFQSSSSR